jgi:hypothetical protein
VRAATRRPLACLSGPSGKLASTLHGTTAKTPLLEQQTEQGSIKSHSLLLCCNTLRQCPTAHVQHPAGVAGHATAHPCAPCPAPAPGRATHLSRVLLRSTNLWRSSCTASASLMTAVPSCCVAGGASPAGAAPGAAAAAAATGAVDIKLLVWPLLLVSEVEGACLQAGGQPGMSSAHMEPSR